jgi:AcrR family transcriptional regulator
MGLAFFALVCNICIVVSKTQVPTASRRGMPNTRSEPGRPAQRRRTRNAIVAAAAGLLSQGKTPSVAEVAEAADVSRRTVYMYFPTLEHLFLDATLGSLASTASIGASIDEHASDEEIEARVERLARLVQRGAAETEQQGRTLLRLTVQSVTEGEPRPPRGYRRVEWVEGIIAPLRTRVDKRRFERLVSALVMVRGWEALIIQRDMRGLDPRQGEELSAWAARALVKATLDEAERDASPRRAAAKKRRATGQRSPRRA